jgi:F1F0 ATPase subunit 2
MTQALPSLIAALVAGCVLGFLFLLSLHRSVQHLTQHRNAALWMVGGMVMRIAIISAALFGILQFGNWQHVLSALLGFTIVRWLGTLRLKSSDFLSTKPDTHE